LDSISLENLWKKLAVNSLESSHEKKVVCPPLPAGKKKKDDRASPLPQAERKKRGDRTRKIQRFEKVSAFNKKKGGEKRGKREYFTCPRREKVKPVKEGKPRPIETQSGKGETRLRANGGGKNMPQKDRRKMPDGRKKGEKRKGGEKGAGRSRKVLPRL